MRLVPWLLLAIVACTQPRDKAVRPAAPPAGAPAAAPANTLPARAVSIPRDVLPYTWSQLAMVKQVVEDLKDCTQPGSCPKTDEGKARRKAERAFACASQDVDAALRKDAVVDNRAQYEERFSLPESDHTFGIWTGGTIPSGDGEVSLFARRATASVFQVVGCNRWGIVVCVTGNRTIRTPDTTYENTEDRVCVWGRPDPEQP